VTAFVRVIGRVVRVCVVGDRVGLIFRVGYVLVGFVLVDSVRVDFERLLMNRSRSLLVRVDFERLLVNRSRSLLVHRGGGLGKLGGLCRLEHLRWQRAWLGGRRRLLAGFESLRGDHALALGRQELLPGPDLLACLRSAGATESNIGGVVTVDRAHCSLPFWC
jgi:hypothetical protein